MRACFQLSAFIALGHPPQYCFVWLLVLSAYSFWRSFARLFPFQQLLPICFRGTAFGECNSRKLVAQFPPHQQFCKRQYVGYLYTGRESSQVLFSNLSLQREQFTLSCIRITHIDGGGGGGSVTPHFKCPQARNSRLGTFLLGCYRTPPPPPPRLCV